MMRIISGSKKGKKLKTLEGLTTRPTAERIKQGIFNILQFEISDRYVLDLFAGSGQMGLECISRGAEGAVFVENDSNAAKIVSDNIKGCNFETYSVIIKKEATYFLKSYTGKPFSLVFLDPPYASDLGDKVLCLLSERKLLTDDCILVYECDEKTQPKEKYGEFVLYDLRTYSRTKVAFYRKDK
ncbi:MAG: 16S rRNA (guanine(966)-N(2))-methyltransferase RsmD [Clostridia bacterium]|nr:16S rRNA (guanine(966)-N(2))-methyltransferase RsmD [Clostridia bacterium]